MNKTSLKTSQIIPEAAPFFFPGGPIGCLLVHGFTGTPKEMRLLGKYLSEHGHTVLGIRLFAHATDPKDMFRARWKDWLADVEDGWYLLNGCCQQVVVMGLSMGGILSLLFASQHQVAGVVAMATPHHLPNDPRIRFIKPLSLLQPYLSKRPPAWFDQDAYRDHISYSSDPTRAFAEVRDMLTEMRANLPKIHSPALLIYSKDDPVVTLQERHMELIYAELGSNYKQPVWIEGSGHVLTRDAKNNQVFAAINNFIESQIKDQPS